MSLSHVVSRIAHESYLNAPSTMPPQPWWQNLETNFARRPTAFDLGTWDRMRVEGTAFIDTILRTSAASLVGFSSLPTGYNPVLLKRMLKEGELYRKLADSHDPEAFFIPPPAQVQVRQGRATGPHFRPGDGVCEHLSFVSPYRPYNHALQKGWDRQKHNSIAHARFWRHNDGPRPVIAAIHGFGADPYWLNEWFFALPWFYQMGYDVLLFTLPFHGRRRANYSLFSGHGFFAGGFLRMNEAFGQAVCDFRVCMNYLRETWGADRIGVTGISLGGYTTALLASVEKRLAFAIPNVPVVSLPDLILEWQPVGAILHPILAATGQSIKDLRHITAVSCALTYKPALPREHLMIIGGVGDRLAPPKHTRLLWDHWGRCAVHWFPGNHTIHLDKGAYLKQMILFLNRIGFSSELTRSSQSGMLDAAI